MSAKNPTPEVTAAREWRKAHEEGVVFHFPSGFQARIRPVSVGTFIRLGRIPDILSSVVQRLIGGENFATLTLEDMGRASDVYDIFCKTCFVYPKVVDEIKDPDSEITAEMISDVDKQTLFQFMGAPASAIADFRPIPQNIMDDLVSQQGNAKST